MRLDARVTLAMLMLGAGLAGPAASQPAPPPLPYAPVPAPRFEQVPPLPGRRFVWEPGHWQWDGAQYAWVGGHYIVRRPHFAGYVPGRWVWRGAWVWVPAHWR